MTGPLYWLARVAHFLLEKQRARRGYADPGAAVLVATILVANVGSFAAFAARFLRMDETTARALRFGWPHGIAAFVLACLVFWIEAKLRDEFLAESPAERAARDDRAAWFLGGGFVLIVLSAGAYGFLGK